MDSTNPVPRYYQIVHSLEQRLHNNHYPPGERFLSEKELELSFGVSRITARRALGELEKKGLVTRHQGKGTFVGTKPQAPEFPKFTGSLDQLFMIGKSAVVKEANVEQVVASPKLKAALQLAESDVSVTRVERVLLLDGRPYAYHQNFYPERIGRHIQRQDILGYPLLDLLERKFHVPVIEVHQFIEAVVADMDVAGRLEVSFGSPLFYVERTLLTERKKPVGFVQAYYRGDGYRLSVTLVRKDKGKPMVWRPPTSREKIGRKG